MMDTVALPIGFSTLQLEATIYIFVEPQIPIFRWQLGGVVGY